MNSISKKDLYGLSMTEAMHLPQKTGVPLAFPTTLSGVTPLPEPAARSDLHQVYALSAVGTFLGFAGRLAFRSLKAVPSLVDRRWADSQGRMDLIARMAEKAKDFVYRLTAWPFGHGAAMARSKP